ERVLDQDRGRVDPDAVGAAVEPEPEDVEVLLAHRGVLPVQVRLLRGEQVQVPLAGGAVGLHGPAPGRTAEVRDPVVRRLVPAGAAAGPEPEPGPLVRAGPGGERGPEPGMLIRYVVRHDVD